MYLYTTTCMKWNIFVYIYNNYYDLFQEVVAAIEADCNIIPVLDSFQWPAPESLPEDMRAICFFNGIRLDIVFWMEWYLHAINFCQKYLVNLYLVNLLICFRQLYFILSVVRFISISAQKLLSPNLVYIFFWTSLGWDLICVTLTYF